MSVWTFLFRLGVCTGCALVLLVIFMCLQDRYERRVKRNGGNP